MLTKFRIVSMAIALILLSQITSAVTLQLDEIRSGNFSDQGPKEGSVIWKANLTGLVGSSPVVWDNKVYVSNWYGWGSWNPGLYSIDAFTGKIIWVNGNITGASTPAIHNGMLIIGSLSGKLYAVNASTGKILWKRVLERNPEWWGIASSPLVYNGRIYVTTFSDGTLHALDMDGNEIWNVTTGNRVNQYASPSAVGGMILFAGNSTSNMLYSVRENGSVAWTFPADGRITGTPSAGYGMIFFTTENRLYALNLNGTEAWSMAFNGTISSPAVAYGKVFAGSMDGRFYCINATSGEVLWVFDANGKIYSSPAVADGVVYFATNVPNGTVYALNVENGSLIWAYSMNPPEGAYYNIMSSPFVYMGMLFIGADDGHLYAFGKNPVIWSGEVELSREKVQVTLKDGSTAEVDGLSAIAALWKASILGNFSVEIVNSSWGLYVESVAGIKPSGLNGWMYWVNYPDEPMPSVGAADYILENGDRLIFYFGSYDPDTWEPSKPDRSGYIVVINVSLSSTLWEGEIILEPENVTISLSDGSNTSISSLSALAALWKASQLGGFNVTIRNTSWGLYVESVADIAPNATHYWLYWVDYPDKPSPSVGAGDYILSDGDTLIFYFGYYNSTTWEPSSPDESPYIVKIHVRITGGAKITGLNVSDGVRGGYATANASVEGLIDGWYVIVVSGTNDDGDSIAGVTVVRLSPGDSLTVPVIIPVPQQAQTGTYRLYAGIYRLSEYPEMVIDIYGSADCEVR